MTRYWLSFDLGPLSYYDGMYEWLDKMHARECVGNMVTFSSNKTPSAIKKGFLLAAERSSKMGGFSHKSLKWKFFVRAYLIYKKRDGKISGKYLVGSRRSAPWMGFAEFATEPDED